MIYILPLLSVFAGYLIAIFLKPSSSVGFKLLLSFSGAYLLAVTIFELLPEVYLNGTEEVGVFIMLGLLLQIILEFVSKGVEHGHLHHQEGMKKFPILLLISLSIHAFLEGFPMDEGDHILHGVVFATILSVFLIHSNLSKIKIGLFLAVFALMTPLGSFFKSQFSLLQDISIYINALVIGIFLHVSTTILFEASKNHKFNLSKLAVIVGGILLAYFL